MDNLKKPYRETEQDVKETLRDVDGHDIGDAIGNAGDEIRKDLGNAGDELRRPIDRELDETETPRTPVNR